MKSLEQFVLEKSKSSETPIQFLFTDIDDTLTDEGQVHAEAYSALWTLQQKGVHVIPVTGRPAGWCEMIARTWPVSGVIGENGGFYFRYKNKKMHREFAIPEPEREQNRKKLEKIKLEILAAVPRCAVASDQFCREMDLAIDFCEDIPALPFSEVQKIVSVFNQHGAQAKVSSIHVNGWFGTYDKLTMTQTFLKKEFQVEALALQECSAFSGDSPNDESLFAFFKYSFAVANIQNFISQLKKPPQYVSPSVGGKGFVEISKALLKSRS